MNKDYEEEEIITFKTKIPHKIKSGMIIKIEKGYDKCTYYTILVNNDEIEHVKYLCYIITKDQIVDIILDKDGSLLEPYHFYLQEVMNLEELYKSWLKNM